MKIAYLRTYLLLDPKQYEFIDFDEEEGLNLEDAESRCKEKGWKLVEPKDIETNDELRKLSGDRTFWIGIKDKKYVSDDEFITWSNRGDKYVDEPSNDKKCFIMGKETEVQGNGANFGSDFGMWSGESCTLKKHSAGCDKKIGKNF